MTKTRKLYYEDAHICAFPADITAVAVLSEGPENAPEACLAVELDRTAFFPEGGGQTSDTGTMKITGGAYRGRVFRVVDVQETDGRILHYLAADEKDAAKGLAAGNRVSCALDWDVRFAKMQNHTAEHIVSGIVHTKYGFENVGFHVSVTRRDSGDADLTGEVTFDFSGELTAEQLRAVEREANAAVRAAMRVTASFPAPEELQNLTYRSKLELTENVRLVTIGDLDVCACCAPHVANTAEIGIIKLLRTERYKGGVRIHMKAGVLAQNDYGDRIALTELVSRFLSCPAEDIPAGLEQLKAADDRAHERRVALEKALADARALFLAASAEDGRPAVLFESLLGEDAVRRIVNETVPAAGASLVAVFFAPNEDGTAWRYVIGSASGDLRPFAKELNAALSGRGGGSPGMIQGTVGASQDAIESFFCRLSG